MNQNPAPEIIRHFQAFLEEAKLSRVSIKNYLSDVRLFLASISFSSIRDLTAEKIQNYLSLARQTKPEATFRRYTASLRRFTTFLSIEYRLELPLLSARDLESEEKPTHNLINQFRLYLTRERKSAATIKNYLSDLNHFLIWTAKQSDTAAATPAREQLAAILSPNLLRAYFDHLKSSQTSTSVSDRRASTLRKFVQFSLDSQLISHNPFEKQEPLPQIATISLTPLPKNPIIRGQTANPLVNLYYRYHSLSFTPYLHLAILVLATTALGIFGYNQIFKDTKPSQAYPTALIRPARQLSFQGRLTDESGNAVTSATSVNFRLFPSPSDGTAAYEAKCSLSPDADGVFSTQIGNGTCGSEIGADVFSQNQSLFLEVAIGGTALTPRQPIATSGYALNSETLQGYPASASATENTVPVVGTDGAIVLGAAAPSILAENGTFAIKGQAVTLVTTPGSDGDISVAPDGRGSVNLIGSLDKGIFVNVTDANLTKGTLIEGYVANNSRSGTLLHLASGTKQINRLTISTTGQTDIIADTYAKPAFSIKQTGTGPIFQALAGKTPVGQISTAGDLGLLGGISLGSPFTTHAWPGQILTNSNSRGMAGVIINQNDSGPIFAASSSGTPRLVIANNGNVGINTINPSEGALVVVGRTWTDQLTVAKNPVSGYVLTSDNGGNATWEPATGGGGGSNGWTLAAPIVYPNLTTYQVLVGATATASALGKLTVYGDSTSAPIAYLSGTTGAAGLIIDNLGSGNLINASASGVNKFTVANDGDITSAAIAVAGGAVWTDSTGNLNSVAGTAGQCLTSGGSGTPVWSSCASELWQRNSGVLSPINITDDLTIGGTATSSAKFQIFGNTGNATSSGNLTFSGTTPTIASRLNTTLTIGDSQTGNIVIAPGGTPAITAIGTNTTLGGNLTVNGTSVTLAGNDTVIDMTGTGTTNLNTVTNRAITTGTGQITLAGNVDATNGLDVTTANLTVGGAKFSVVPASGDVTTAGNVAVNGGDITTSATTFNLAGTTSTLNFAGGSGSTGCTVDGTTGNFTCSANITTTAASGIQGWWQRNAQALSPTSITDDLLLGATATASALIKFSGTPGNNSWINTGNFGIGTTTPSEKLDVVGSATVSGNLTFYGGARTIASRQNTTLTIGDSQTGNIIMSPQAGAVGASVTPSTDNQVDLGTAALRWRNVYAGSFVGGFNPGFTAGSVIFTGPSGELAQDNANFFFNDTTNQLGLGTASPLARLDVRASNGITPAVTISATSSFAALVVDNSGVGDIFTASSSGLNRFVITQAGNVGIGTTTPSYKLDVSGGTGIVGQFSGRVIGGDAINSNEFVTLSQIGGGAGGPWSRVAPNVYLTTSTDQVGIGTSTPVGKFQIINGVGTTSAASVSATSSFAALVVDNSGVGDIFTASASGLNRFVITSAGNVGINTTLPSEALDLVGNATISGNLTFYGAARTIASRLATSLTLGDSQTGNLIINNGGRTAFYHTTPLATVDIHSNLGTIPVASVSGATSFAALVVDNSGVGDIFTASSSGLNRFVIKQNGYVGIGTTAPTAKLNFAAATTNTEGILFGTDTNLYRSAANVLTTDDTFSAVTALQSGGTIEALRNFSVPQRFFISSANDASVPVLYVDSAGQITMNSQGTQAIRFNFDKGTGGVIIGNGASGEVARFTSTGNVGINTPTPLATLDIRRNVGTAPAASISGATSFATLIVDNSGVGDIFTASSSGLNRFVITQAGNVGIGTTTPAAPLHVSGTSAIFGVGEAGTPTATTIRGAAASGSNIAGANLTFDASNGTGSGGSGALAFRTAPSSQSLFYDNASSVAETSNPQTWTHTITSSQTNRLLIVTNSAWGVSAPAATAVTYGGQSMTLLSTSTRSSGDAKVQMWYLKEAGIAAASSSTVSVTMAAASDAVFGATSYYNVDQTTPFGTAVTAEGSSGTASVDVGSTTGEIVVDALISFGPNTPTAGAGQTERYSTQDANARGYSSTEAGATSVTMSWTFTSSQWATIGVSVKPVSGTTANTLAERLRITNTGNVGIGTATPGELLDVVGSATISGNLTFYGGARTIASRLKTTLTIGDSQTGNILMSPHGGVLGAYVAPSTDAQVDLGQSTLRWRNLYVENVFATGISGTTQGFWQRNTASLSPAFLSDDVLTGSISTSSAWVKLTGTAGNPSFVNTGSFGVGTMTTLATTDLRSMLGTVPVASISGATSLAALVVDNSGVGDLFTASSSGLNRFVITQAGNVGIGTTLPGELLDVVGSATISGNLTFYGGARTIASRLKTTLTIGDSQTGRVAFFNTTPLASVDIRPQLGTIPVASISGAVSMATLIVDNSLNYDIFAASSSGARRLGLASTGDLTLYGSSGVASPPTGRLMPGTDAVQDIGSSTQQWKSIYLSNAIQNGATVAINLATQHFGDNGTGRWTFDLDASVSGSLNVVGTTWLGCNVAAPPGCGNPFTSLMIAGVDGTGKIDVGTIDPPYSINGEKYATYLPGMVGQNEEVTGNIATSELVVNVGYRTTIDFSNLPKASNLWLFSKVTDLKTHIRDLAVILTPGSAARAWYVLEPDQMLLHIYTSQPTAVSYRFTAPRFDSAKWINTRPAEGITGFVINNPDLPLNGLADSGPIALDPTFTETNINQYQLALGNDVVAEIGSYASLLVANLKAGIVTTQKLISPIAEIDLLKVNAKLLSPLAEIDEIKATTVSAQTVIAADLQSPVIDNLNQKYASASAILAALKAKYSDYASLTAPEPGPVASISGEYTLYNQPVIITDTLLVNTSLVSNSVNSADDALYLQPTASAPINLLAGLMTLSPDGQVTINGDLTVTGKLYANNINGNQTTTNQLILGKEATPSADSLASFFDQNGNLVSAINASGAASFKEIATNGLLIASAATESASATSSATLSTNATIGTAAILAGTTELTISNTNVRTGTYVYLTPISDTANQVLYVKAKEEGVGFTVAINQPLTADIKFNYWLIQTQP